MSDSKDSYKQIVKNTTLLGGVQVVQILATVLRGKFVAMLLGVTGIGINALLSSAILLVVQFSSLGINFSAVREIAQAHGQGDQYKLQHTIQIFKRWNYFCAILGVATICIFSNILSVFSFGNNSYTSAFIFASLAVAFTILSSANITILQGEQRLHTMAKVSLWSAFLGLIFCLPCYYFFNLKGILPALILTAVVSFFISSFFSKKLPVTSSNISIRETFISGSVMAKLGITMMTVTVLGTAATYIFNTYINGHGSVSDVGLYTAGTSITNQYIGIVFTAMAIDYFPKLSAVCTDKLKVNEIVNSQSEIVILISAPILIIMMLSAPIIIRLLLSSQFLAITNFIYWAAFAMLFKAASFAVGYISFAKGDKKTFFIFEGVFGNLLILIFNIVGFKLRGITGIAQGILACYIIYLIAVNLLASRLYGFQLKKAFVAIFIKLTLLLGSALYFVLHSSNRFAYILSFVSLLLTLYYSYSELNKRILIKQLILSRFKK